MFVVVLVLVISFSSDVLGCKGACPECATLIKEYYPKIEREHMKLSMALTEHREILESVENKLNKDVDDAVNYINRLLFEYDTFVDVKIGFGVINKNMEQCLRKKNSDILPISLNDIRKCRLDNVKYDYHFMIVKEANHDRTSIRYHLYHCISNNLKNRAGLKKCLASNLKQTEDLVGAVEGEKKINADVDCVRKAKSAFAATIQTSKDNFTKCADANNEVMPPL